FPPADLVRALALPCPQAPAPEDRGAVFLRLREVMGMRRVTKRAFDLAVAVPALLLLAPLMVLLALLVRLKLGSPVLFGQVRPGLNERPFPILKFRTMTDARDAQGNLLDEAERLTPIGRFLRSSSLDELPELFNVLRGEMSLVGPRPLLMRYLDRYSPEQ